MLIMRQTMSYHDFFDSGRGESSNEFTRIVKFSALYFSMWAILKKKHVKLVYGCLIILVCIYMLTGARGLSITYIGILLLLVPISHGKLFQKRYVWAWLLGACLRFLC